MKLICLALQIAPHRSSRLRFLGFVIDHHHAGPIPNGLMAFSIGSKRTVLVTAGSSLRAFQSLVYRARAVANGSTKSPSSMQPVACAPTSFKRIAVIGASGYGGLQTLRLLQDHPHFEVSFLAVSAVLESAGRS